MAYRDELDAALARTSAAERRALEAESELARLRADLSAAARRQVADGRVFLGIGGHALALAADGGRILWQTKLSMATTTLVVVESGALFAASMGKVYRLDLDKGTILWTNPMARLGTGLPSLAPVPDGMTPGHVIFAGIGSTVLALDAVTGEERWRRRLAGRLKSDFTNVVLLGLELYATALGEVWCLDPGTGEPRWHDKLEGRGYGLATLAPAGLGQLAVTAAHVSRVKARAAAG